jgi:hypothetical protein
MPGGMMNIAAEGNNNVFLTGNPTKTFFNVAYSKYTNFGLQKFRLDYDGMRDLRTTEESLFKFKIKRYGDLLMDTYLVIHLPDIYSPLYPPCPETGGKWAPYDFRWIKDIGTQIIKEISITCGSITLQRYTGDYLYAMMERDFTGEKKELYNRMTGNVVEVNDPCCAYGRSNCYPSAFYTSDPQGAEPSIRARTLYIPINAWFTLNSKCAFPLVSLQYNELEISVTLRPIQELFSVRDVFDPVNQYPYIQPDFNKSHFQMYRFLQSPPSVKMEEQYYGNQTKIWNADIHLLATYCFLSKDESQLFASKEQLYLVRDVFQYKFDNITGSKRVKLTSNGMIANWMFYLQRNDVNMRNEWSNYTNWPYSSPPLDILNAPEQLPTTVDTTGLITGPKVQPGGTNSGYYVTPTFSAMNQKNILLTMGILLNGEYRENTLTHEIYDYVEKYVRTPGSAKDGLYCYNFCLNTNPMEYQPSGAINMSKFKTVELEITTIPPAVDTINSSFDIICGDNGQVIGYNKQNWRLFEYNYNLVVFEERFNVLSFISGQCGMMLAR